MNDKDGVDVLSSLGNRSRYGTSVCSGSLILAAAGLLDGYRANTHWSYRGVLARFLGVELTDGRVVTDRSWMTGGGVTAGIDFSLVLVGAQLGDERAALLQLLMECNPKAPYTSGYPDFAPAELVAVA
ncbi:DJ-1/PfpI family protein [Streptomyces sp. NPDC001068]|uniref:DJ-1/PfpI family protein n=1 Tax=Streptomyces sp. NPDC001068 TaxID=3364544 RepID=UPI0036A8057C